MTPLHLPLTATDRTALTATLAREWPDAARVCGVDRPDAYAEVLPMGTLRVAWNWLPSESEREAGRCALSRLAERLEDRGYAVDWQAGVRVVGWAAYRSGTTTMLRRIRGTTLVADFEHDVLRRIADLDPSDPRHRAHDDALYAARVARRGPGPAADARREGALARHAAAYPKGER